MHPGRTDLLMLLVFLAGSFLAPVVAKRVRVPSAVLLIAFGVAIGPDALGLPHSGRIASFLFELGFLVLMFLAGMEIDFNRIRRRGRRALIAVTGICLAICGLAFLLAWALGLSAIFGLALGATSVGLPLAVLKETGQLRSAVGQQILLLGSVGEALTVVGMTLFYFLARYGLSPALLWSLGKLLGLLLVAGLFLRVFLAVAWWQPERFAKVADADEQSEIGVRAALVLMLAFSMLGIFAGIEAIVGAFVSGALLSFVLRGKRILEEKVAVVGHGLFIPLFFIVVGMRFDLGAVSGGSLASAALLLGAAFVVRVLPCLALVRLGASTREALGTASLLSAPLTLVVAIASLGAELGYLEPDGVSTLVVLAVASGVVFPVLFRSLAPTEAIASAGSAPHVAGTSRP